MQLLFVDAACWFLEAVLLQQPLTKKVPSCKILAYATDWKAEFLSENLKPCTVDLTARGDAEHWKTHVFEIPFVGIRGSEFPNP